MSSSDAGFARATPPALRPRLERLPLPRRIAHRAFSRFPDDRLPHTLSHRRLYILPTRRGAVFLMALLLMLVTSVNYALSLGYALCFLLTGLCSAALLHTYRNLAGIVVDAIRPATAFHGDVLRFEIELKNPTSLARRGIDVSTDEYETAPGGGGFAATPAMPTRAERPIPHGALSSLRPSEPDAGMAQAPGKHLVLPARDRCVAHVPVTAHRRGHRPLGRLTLSSDYPLGLWRAWSYLHIPVTGLVYPSPETGAPRCSDADRTREPHDTAYDSGEFERYRIGDSPSRIAWKLAARSGSLHVRHFAGEPPAEPVVLDLERAGPGGLEARLSRLTAWVLRCAESGRPFSLRLPGTDVPEATGDEVVRTALSALALYRAAR